MRDDFVGNGSELGIAGVESEAKGAVGTNDVRRLMEQGSDKAQCGGGILCADVDGLAVDDGAQVAEDRVGEQGQIGAQIEPPSSEASRRCTVQRTRPLRC